MSLSSFPYELERMKKEGGARISWFLAGGVSSSEPPSKRAGKGILCPPIVYYVDHSF